jgi:hypothetical protein
VRTSRGPNSPLGRYRGLILTLRRNHIVYALGDSDMSAAYDVFLSHAWADGDRPQQSAFYSGLTTNTRRRSAIRGQPQRGFRCFISTTALMSSALGPFGPGLRL